MEGNSSSPNNHSSGWLENTLTIQNYCNRSYWKTKVDIIYSPSQIRIVPNHSTALEVARAANTSCPNQTVNTRSVSVKIQTLKKKKILVIQKNRRVRSVFLRELKQLQPPGFKL